MYLPARVRGPGAIPYHGGGFQEIIPGWQMQFNQKECKFFCEIKNPQNTSEIEKYFTLSLIQNRSNISKFKQMGFV